MVKEYVKEQKSHPEIALTHELEWECRTEVPRLLIKNSWIFNSVD